MPARSLLTQGLACAFFVSASSLFDRANRDRPKAYFGVGAFNMIRAEMYRSFGKGKRYNSSYGNARSQVTAKATGSSAAPVGGSGLRPRLTRS